MLTSQKNKPLKRAQTFFLIIDKYFEAMSEFSKYEHRYVALFSQKNYLSSFNVLKNFLEKNGDINSKSGPEKIVVNPIYREALDGITNAGAMLFYTNPTEFKKIAEDFEVFTKHFRNNKDLNRSSASRSSFALLDFCVGNIESAKLEIKKMYGAAIEEKAEKLKIPSNLLDYQTITKTLTNVMKKESGQSEVPFFYKNFPSEFLKLVGDMGEEIIDSTINKFENGSRHNPNI